MNKTAMIYNETNLETKKHVKLSKLCAITRQVLLNFRQNSTKPTNSFQTYQNQISDILWKIRTKFKSFLDKTEEPS